MAGCTGADLEEPGLEGGRPADLDQLEAADYDVVDDSAEEAAHEPEAYPEPEPAHGFLSDEERFKAYDHDFKWGSSGEEGEESR